MTQETYVCNVGKSPDVGRLAKNMESYAEDLQAEGRTEEADELRQHAADLSASQSAPPSYAGAAAGGFADPAANAVDPTPPVMPTLSDAK